MVRKLRRWKRAGVDRACPVLRSTTWPLLDGRTRSGQRPQSNLAHAPRTLLASAVFALVVSGCGGESSTAEERPASWTVEVPVVEPHSRQEIIDILKSADGSGPTAIDVGEVSAAVFERGSATLDTNHPEWQNLVAAVCGDEGLVENALAEGWDVRIKGFVDSTGAMGPGTLNDELQETRPASARTALVAECEIPADRISTEKGGIGGEGAEARKVTVEYVRSDPFGEGP